MIKQLALYLVGILLSAAISFYTFWSAVFYGWMNANGSWSAEKSAPWAYGFFSLSVIFCILSVYLIVKSVKFINAYKSPANLSN